MNRLQEIQSEPEHSTSSIQQRYQWLLAHYERLNENFFNRPGRRPINPAALQPTSRCVYNKVTQIANAFDCFVHRINCYRIQNYHEERVEMLYSFTEVFRGFTCVERLKETFKQNRIRRVFSRIRWADILCPYSIWLPSSTHAALVSRLHVLATSFKNLSLRQFVEVDLQANQDLQQYNQLLSSPAVSPPVALELPPPVLSPPASSYRLYYFSAGDPPCPPASELRKQIFVEHQRTEALRLLEHPDKMYEKEEECHVCCEPIQEPLSCGHFVHTKCIVLSKKCTCPFCFKSVLLSDDEYAQMYDLGARIVV